MVYEIPDDGLNAITDAVTTQSGTHLNSIAVGTGTSIPSTGDVTLDNKIYEGISAYSNTSFSRTANTGEITASIRLAGGTEVSGGTTITEIGLKSNDDRLVYREVLDSPVTVPHGEFKVIDVTMTIDDHNPGESTTVITDGGRNYVADRLVSNSTEIIDRIAVGTGTSNVSASDTSMISEVHREDDSNSGTDISSSASVPGNIDALISVSAGTNGDVSSGTTISEFGIFTDNSTLVLHESSSTGTTITNEKAFEIPFKVIR